MVMALAGNKADLEDKRKVTAEVSKIVFQYSFYSMSAAIKNYIISNSIMYSMHYVMNYRSKR